MTPIGRIAVLDVAPVVDGGARPAKSVVGEEFQVTATVFREGHEAVGATVVCTDPGGRESPVPMVRVNAGLDAWSATVCADRPGRWSYRVEGW
ncbi:maltotransferase domain-containing protein [Actinoplanes sp. RD1]|uniref:maltotransferase domain-containing protein n=1 Tax=Actinoplanes sp. RD1 TaxID=3064538 RepID=UPI0027428DAC|nr:maltotransferase domain-containing protein [Actinoplanes sp. RD1]